ncbi:B12-binding domain-containing radical SAM protein [bacterium]|nr:B12-binding domain-containing radical SAM protein [bacterium]
MRIVLVKPPSKIHLVVPPIGLAYLAAGCGGHEVDILDCLRDRYDHQDFKRYIQQKKPDLVGLTAFSLEIDSALHCLQIVKSIDPGIVTIVGGAHASNVPEEVLRCPDTDYIMIGEGDRAFPKFADAVQNGSDVSALPGLGYRFKDEIRINAPQLITDLDSIPFPRFDLLRLDEYPRTYQARRFPVAPIITSRGCPFECTFCSGHTISGRTFRARSPRNVLEEIRVLIEHFQVKEISIYDDNFTLNKRRTRQICELLVQADLDLIWNLPNGLRIETLDAELLKLMKRAGCYEICSGIESCSDPVLRAMKKNISWDTIKNKVPLISRAGIRSTGFFILGYPTETRKDMAQTVKNSRKLKLDRARFFLFQPLPGSEAFMNLVQQKIIDPDLDWNCMDYSKAHVVPPGFTSKKELEKIQRNAILFFYLRPFILIKYIWQNLSLDQLRELLAMVKTYIFHR